MTKKRCHGITRSGRRCKKKSSGGAFCAAHPLKGGMVTKTGFSAMQGFDASMTSHHLRAGTIEETDAGFIEWENAQQEIAKTRDPTQPLRRQGDPHPDADVADVVTITSGDVEEANAEYTIARAKREKERARLSELERMGSEGQLIDAEQVALDVADMLSTLRQSLRTIPHRLASQLHGCETVRDVHDMLAKDIDDALHECADRFDEMRPDTELQAAE